MPETVIADTSALILFSKIGELSILQKVYSELTTTPQVVEEFLEPLPDWVRIKSVSDKKYQHFLETQVDKGEASAIALAIESDDVILLVDDLKARGLASSLKLKITGTLGVLTKAKEKSIIREIKPLIEKILLTDFRIADNIIDEVLRLNNE